MAIFFAGMAVQMAGNAVLIAGMLVVAATIEPLTALVLGVTAVCGAAVMIRLRLAAVGASGPFGWSAMRAKSSRARSRRPRRSSIRASL